MAVSAKTDEIPPNKTIAAVGGTSAAGALVAVVLWAFGSNPPTEIVIALTTIANMVVGAASVYFTPVGVKK